MASGTGGLLSEHGLRNAEQTIGYRDYVPLPLSAWTETAGTAVDGSGAIARTTGDFGYVIRLAAAFTTTDILKHHSCLPMNFKHYKRSTAEGPYLRLKVKYRMLDVANAGAGGATANADLALTCSLLFHGVADTAVTTVAADNVVIGATDYIAGAEQGAAWAEFDMIDNMTAAEKAALDPGASFAIHLSTNEAVGTDLAVELLAFQLVMDKHLNPLEANI